MRLLSHLVCLALVALTASAISQGQLYINLSTIGYTEVQGVKHFVFGVDVTNRDLQQTQVSSSDFVARDPYGTTYQVTGDELKLQPGASGRLSLAMQGKISPQKLIYSPEQISLDLSGRL